MGCGSFSEVSNSEDWAMEVNITDPTTGITGIKVDNIPGFGKDPEFSSFEVSFTFCPDQECEGEIACITPEVAYKAGQCIHYEQVEVDCEEVAPLSVTVQKHDPLCAGAADGGIELQVSGGLPPYLIEWNTGDTGPVLNGIPAGMYSYFIYDQEEAVLSGEVSLAEPAAIEVTGIVSHPVCGTAAQGGVDITVSGGVAPYSYAWSHGMSTEDVAGLEAGSYTVTVTDDNGCAAERTFSLSTQSGLQVSADIVHPSCDGSRAGSIALAINGGTEPYTVEWSNTEQTGMSISGLAEGYYRATITDQNGCQFIRTYSGQRSTSNYLSTKWMCRVHKQPAEALTWRLREERAPTLFPGVMVSIQRTATTWSRGDMR